ncbi:MAG TPA: sortase [Chloroflexota bacterium]|nr:sortase [Chloroflexota bacterium]
MAERSSSDASDPADWGRRLAGAGLILLGVAGVAIAGWAYLDAWSTSQTWNASPQAAALARQAIEPTPVWLPTVTPGPAPTSAPIEPLPTQGVLSASVPVPQPMAAPTAVVFAAAEDLSLDASDFRFIDPPEPDAHARVAVTVTNHGAAPSQRVLLGVPASWFEDYRIIGTAPAVSDDRTDDAGLRSFSFPPLNAGSTATFELHVTAIGEGTQAPAVKVLSQSGDLIGEATLSTSAPTPRPGPVMSIDIPALKLHSGVVQIAFEPPPFAVGQLNGSANITQGNTVLVGHLTGAAGNIFAHLDQLKPGDEITATSRGLPYAFVVSRTYESANDDPAPLRPADDARLTLMTCAGVWNPFTHDYSKRLWIVAEPPDRAAVTIAAAAATATAEATAAVAATSTALALVPTLTPTPVFVGEPSLPGGIGNTRVDLENVLGKATGETLGKLVVFRQPGREFHVVFTPDPPRAALVAEILAADNRLTFDAAVREARKLFPLDTRPRAAAPEGNSLFVVERFTSPTLAQALGTGDFSVVYTRDATGAITSILLGLGDDFQALIQQSRR